MYRPTSLISVPRNYQALSMTQLSNSMEQDLFAREESAWLEEEGAAKTPSTFSSYIHYQFLDFHLVENKFQRLWKVSVPCRREEPFPVLCQHPVRALVPFPSSRCSVEERACASRTVVALASPSSGAERVRGREMGGPEGKGR